jgi:hypothetical protein
VPSRSVPIATPTFKFLARFDNCSLMISSYLRIKRSQELLRKHRMLHQPYSERHLNLYRQQI